MIKPNVVGYHCNDFHRCHKFISSKDYLIISEEDGKWLGTGMYFWDNVANANFWMGKKKRENPCKTYGIVAANIFLDRLLDLTDIDICDKIGEIWEVFKKKTGIENEKNQELGYKLNILFQAVKPFQEKYSVIKVYGKYNRTPENKLFLYNIRKNNAEPFASVKCIYNVKDAEAIGNREMM